ncbi:OsmC family protein [Pseudomonas nicosulfuronedens]|uniref:OsmC family protein n=1 Tax=Pseudomonas nicosulfuronedens TaxID=2571105 RepID=A0A5R9RPX4_9PSED|nr:OsmC family protein [Pseudomonas nicosulfuronedens]MDH1010205.1 OsmC family protein [Pseudomonas nicosulfuronedens]MDH1980314.1 OsmC family protein [Pseudomonas nicosulfuronedens]MDH2025440.1 OsmC family protein [Pseudomonas nicosulfuronedens]TLX78844.1 OsmC family protein [Pseudomonas nicosulfuronedens]
MSSESILAAQQRLTRLVQQRPGVALVEETPAIAQWEGAGKTHTRHPDGNVIHTDLPRELGGDGERISPGWLLRAAMASCAVTRIAMLANETGVALQKLEAEVGSITDVHGLLGLSREDGQPASPGPTQARLQVRIAAAQVPDEQLRELVSEAIRLSPMVAAFRDAIPVQLDIDTGPA